MRLCVLVASLDPASEPHYAAFPAFDPRPWLEGHTCEYHLLEKATAASAVRRLAGQGFDVFINLCEGYSNEEVAGVEVVRGALALRRGLHRGTNLASGAFHYAGTPDGAFHGATAAAGTGITISAAGGTETRPLNVAVSYIIKL